MILLTIGTQLAFDRLVKAVDELAPSLDEPIFGQIGKTATYIPKNFEYCLSMQPKDFDRQFRAARIILSHAGIGTILTSRKHGKPIVVVPRRASYGEHRNDHQLATCAQLKDKPGIHVAMETEHLGFLLRQPDLTSPSDIGGSPERARLIQGIKDFTRELASA